MATEREENVVLVDEHGRPVGQAEKPTVHRRSTPRHPSPVQQAVRRLTCGNVHQAVLGEGLDGGERCSVRVSTAG